MPPTASKKLFMFPTSTRFDDEYEPLPDLGTPVDAPPSSLLGPDPSGSDSGVFRWVAVISALLLVSAFLLVATFLN